MAGILTVEQCGNVFKTREASAHYGIDSKGRVGQYVLEENTAWHCANKSYNQRSIGIELSNDAGARFSISPDGTLRSDGTPPTGWHNGNVIYICE